MSGCIHFMQEPASATNLTHLMTPWRKEGASYMRVFAGLRLIPPNVAICTTTSESLKGGIIEINQGNCAIDLGLRIILDG